MSREIIFRGRRVDNGEWVYGSLIDLDKESDYLYIMKPHLGASILPPFNLIRLHSNLVDPETVGQWTGLVDKNSVKIFEGDVLDTPRWVVTYLANINEGYGMDAGWYVQRDDFESWEELYCIEDYKVIGNIHDNPELVKPVTDVG